MKVGFSYVVMQDLTPALLHMMNPNLCNIDNRFQIKSKVKWFAL